MRESNAALEDVATGAKLEGVVTGVTLGDVATRPTTDVAAAFEETRMSLGRAEIVRVRPVKEGKTGTNSAALSSD